MLFDYSKLKGKIIECFNSQSVFAGEMRWSERTLSLKLSGKVYWKQPEIIKAMNLLGLSIDDIAVYFFTLKVQ